MLCHDELDQAYRIEFAELRVMNRKGGGVDRRERRREDFAGPNDVGYRGQWSSFLFFSRVLGAVLFSRGVGRANVKHFSQQQTTSVHEISIGRLPAFHGDQMFSNRVG